MNEVEQLKKQIIEYKAIIQKLEKDIIKIQNNCQHEFSGNTYVHHCNKCCKVIPLYY